MEERGYWVGVGWGNIRFITLGMLKLSSQNVKSTMLGFESEPVDSLRDMRLGKKEMKLGIKRDEFMI